jgi:hypothetical protein
MDAQDARARVADDRPVVVRHDDGPGLIPAQRRSAPAAPRRRGPSLRRAVLAGVAAGLLLAAALGGWWAARGDDPVRTTPALGAAAPAVPDRLSLEVTATADVVAGRPATLVVRYADGAGTFSGSSEEWGDEVGTSSVKEGRCPAGATDGPATGTYRATHTWSDPGSYLVKVAVSSYTCDTGTPVEEQASTTVTVVVGAP